MKYAHNRQNETSDCGIAVVQTILQRLDLSFENIHEKIEHVINANDTASEVQGLTLWDIQGLLKEFGITSDSYEITDIAKLSSQKYPSVVMVENEGMPHYW